MNILDHSYSGQLFRPKPIVKIDSSQSLFIIATPWGSRDQAEEFVDKYIHFFSNLFQDPEATTPLEMYSNQSKQQNNLRAALSLTNKSIYLKNENEYSLGMELLAGTIVNNELSWVQVGNPNFMISRNDKIAIISSTYDMGFEFSKQTVLPPLPNQLIGINKNIEVEVKSIKLQASDRIIFYSGNILELNTISSQDIQQLSRLAAKISNSSPDSPFWLAELEA